VPPPMQSKEEEMVLADSLKLRGDEFWRQQDSSRHPERSYSGQKIKFDRA